MSAHMLKTIVAAGLLAIPGMFASVSPAGAGQTSGMEMNADRRGSDYKDFDLAAPDPAACQAACQGESACQAWTYVKPGYQGPAARCWLKSAVPSPTVSDCCISGVRTVAPQSFQPPARVEPPIPHPTSSMQQGIDLPGHDYKHFDLPVADAAVCQAACHSESACQAWTFVKPGVQTALARCWLKSAVPSSRPSECCTSGVKQASSRMAGLLIEAEDETESWMRPLHERPAPNMEEIAPAWRPPYSGRGDWYLAAGGEFLRYRIDVPVAATYNLWVRDYVDRFQPRGVRRIVVEWDGRFYGTFGEVDKDAPGDRGIFGWHKVGSGIYLAPGSHTLTVTKEATTAGAAILDAFYLTADPADRPPEK